MGLSVVGIAVSRGEPARRHVVRDSKAAAIRPGGAAPRSRTLSVTDTSGTRTKEPQTSRSGAEKPPARTYATVAASLPERLSYRIKKLVLGPPLVTDQLAGQRERDEDGLAGEVGWGVAWGTSQRGAAVGICERGDLASPNPYRGSRCILPGYAHHRGHRGSSGCRDDLLPRCGSLLSEGRRLLRSE